VWLAEDVFRGASRRSGARPSPVSSAWLCCLIPCALHARVCFIGCKEWKRLRGGSSDRAVRPAAIERLGLLFFSLVVIENSQIGDVEGKYLVALLWLGMSKCRRQMSWGPHTGVPPTPQLQRTSAGEAWIGPFLWSRSPWAARWPGSVFCCGEPFAWFRLPSPDREPALHLHKWARRYSSRGGLQFDESQLEVASSLTNLNLR